MKKNLNIYIIAGEASGDIYGGKLIDSLKKSYDGQINFSGIGGESMTKQGLKSLFNMQELSIMGFWEVLPHIPKMLKRINQTVEDILRIKPDLVITIDSPGFCCRVAKKLQGRGIPLMHYVAPTVWAYKPKRAQKFANLFDHLLVILPFEKPYFDEVSLACTYIGHPIVETKIADNAGEEFRKNHNIENEDILLTIMAGSRKVEIEKLLPIFLKAAENLKEKHKNLKIVIPTIKALREFLESKIKELSDIDYILVDESKQKHAAYKASNAAIVKSGTGSFEIAIAKCPMVIAYKIGFISHKLIKMMVKIKFANLINIICGKEIIKELLQENCTNQNIEIEIEKLLSDKEYAQNQLNQSKQVLEQLGQNATTSPSQNAANAVLNFLKL